MTNYLEYEKILQQQLQDLKTTHNPIVLFGTMDMALFAKRAVDFLNLEITCFTDNNSTKWGKSIDGIPIVSPQHVKELYPNAQIYICSFQANNVKEIIKQLQKMEFDNLYNCDVLFYVYQIMVQKRPIVPLELAKTLEILTNSEDKVILDHVGIMITEKCTLNCKDCGAFIPYHINPKNYDKEIVIETARQLSNSVDAIKRLVVMGGEPLLHPDFSYICEELSKLPNVCNLTFPTNGTIVPSNSELEKLKHFITYVNISDYGKFSLNKEKLINKLNSNQIHYITSETNDCWTELKLPQKHNRSLKENNEIFASCKWLDCPTITDGKYYRCWYYAHLGPFDIVPETEKDYVNLLDYSLTVEEKRRKLQEYINGKNGLTACDYCDFFEEIPVEKALQTKGKLFFKRGSSNYEKN